MQLLHEQIEPAQVALGFLTSFALLQMVRYSCYLVTVSASLQLRE